VSVNTVGTPPAVPTGFDVRVEGTPGSSTYTYAVSAWNGGGESAKTGTITVSNGQASPDSVNKIRLDWYPVTGAQGYVIYGRHGTGTWLDVNIYGEWVYYDDDDHDIEKSGAPTLPTGPHNETLSDTPGTADWYFNPIAKTITRNLGVLPAGTEVTIRYRANYPIILYADDAAEQTARGIHEVLIRDETALTLAQAQAVADNALAKYVEQRRLVTYETRGKGLAVGQSQTIVIARRDLNAQFLITEIETHDNLDSKLSRRVTLQEATTFQGSWRDVYTQWSQGGSGGAVVTTGGGGGTAGTAHHLTHEPGGSDPLFVDNDPVIGSLRTLGTGARQAAPGSALANYVLRADLDDVHQRGTRAAQPAATAVPAGTLYFVTDENVQERSTGTAWQAYTGVAAHHGTHEPGGSDPLAVDAAAATGSLRTLGTGATQAAPGSALADYLLLADVDQIIRRGTRAAQPAATAVTAGTLYCVTDERLEVERSNGTSWEPFARRRHVAIYPYTFSDTLTEPPTGNQVRLNAAHPYTAVTKIWLRYVGRDGVDYWRGLATKTGVSIVIQDENDHTIVAEFVTTADAIDKGTYFEWPVSHVAHSSTAFINNQTVLVLKL
jgi:hypothetical protein